MLEPFQVELVRVARTPRAEPLVHAVGEWMICYLPLKSSFSFFRLRPNRAPDWRKAVRTHAPGALLVMQLAVRLSILPLSLKRSTRAKFARPRRYRPRALPDGHLLWRCPNLLLTPHVAGSTPQFAPRALKTAADELRRYMNGELLRNVVQAAI